MAGDMDEIKKAILKVIGESGQHFTYQLVTYGNSFGVKLSGCMPQADGHAVNNLLRKAFPQAKIADCPGTKNLQGCNHQRPCAFVGIEIGSDLTRG